MEYLSDYSIDELQQEIDRRKNGWLVYEIRNPEALVDGKVNVVYGYTSKAEAEKVAKDYSARARSDAWIYAALPTFVKIDTSKGYDYRK